MKWTLFILIFTTSALANSSLEDMARLKTSSKTKAHLRDAQRSLASVHPALKPIHVRKMKAKALILQRD
jgi:hypothetical protein